MKQELVFHRWAFGVVIALQIMTLAAVLSILSRFTQT